MSPSTMLLGRNSKVMSVETIVAVGLPLSSIGFSLELDSDDNHVELSDFLLSFS